MDGSYMLPSIKNEKKVRHYEKLPTILLKH